MKNYNRIKNVASVLALCSMISFIVNITISPTQARYINQKSWQSTIDAPIMTSDLLTYDQITVVCQPLDLDGTTELEITVLMENGNKNAEIYAETNGGYVDVNIDSEIVLIEGENIIDVSFEHNGDNEETKTEMVYISITTDTQKLSGIFVFQVQGTDYEKQYQIPDEEILEEYEPEVDESEDVGNMIDDTDSSDGTTEETTPDDDDEDGTTTDDTGSSDGTTEETTPDDETEEKEPEDPASESDYDINADTVMHNNITIEKMSSNSNILTESSVDYLKNKPINIEISSSDEKTVFYFDEDDYTCPIYTRYSIDGGQSYIAIAYEKSIVVTNSENIVLDLTWVNIGGTIEVYALQGEESTDSIKLYEQEQLRINSQTDLIASAYENIELEMNSEDINLTLELLTYDGYIDVDVTNSYYITEDTDIIDLEQDETLDFTEKIYPSIVFEDKTITISANGNQAYAGTYRLTISKSGGDYEEYIQVVFFVNYSDGTLEKNYNMEEIDNA